jgi:Flp pilus assembly protein TadB
MGWREGERKSYPSGNSHPGFFFYGFFLLLVLCFFKVAIETGNPLGVLFGIAIVAGLLKGKS